MQARATGMRTAKRLVANIQKELEVTSKSIVSHAFIREAEEGALPRSKLQAFAEQQYHIISGDLRSIAHCAARFREAKARDFFLQVLEGEKVALSALPRLAWALGLSVKQLERSQPRAGALAFTCYFARLAIFAEPYEMAGAMLIDFDLWGQMCSRLRRSLVHKYGLSEADVKFLEGFYPVPKTFIDSALELVRMALSSRDVADRVRTSARLALEYEKTFWDTVYAS